MTTPGRVAGIVFAGLLALACGDPAGRPLPDLEASTERAVTGLERAVAIASLPGDRFAVAEAGPDSASGRVRRIDPRRPAAGATLTRVPPPGPAGAAVDPDFLSTRRLWWTAGSSMAGIEVEGDDPVALTDLPATAGPVAVGADGRVSVGVAAGALGATRDRGRRGPGGAILR
ncbi:MAG: hypothetical protein R3326_06775, partial [Gemmatimonadota bacterium]|nr:hypothetical protein [Gemmatimonadota bacterium]